MFVTQQNRDRYINKVVHKAKQLRQVGRGYLPAAQNAHDERYDTTNDLHTYMCMVQEKICFLSNFFCGASSIRDDIKTLNLYVQGSRYSLGKSPTHKHIA